MVKDCIFCKIIKGEVPGAKIFEGKRSIAVLDAFPAARGQFLVIPKKHVTSTFTKVPDHVLADAVLTAKKVAKHVDFRLGTRSYEVIEGADVPHLHVKVYPAPKGTFLHQLLANEPEKADFEKLKELASQLKLNSR